MKQSLSTIVIVSAITIITGISCTKEDPSNGGPVSPSSYSPPQQQPLDLYLVANNWVNYENQIYVNTFKGVLAPANIRGNSTVLVYVEENGKEAQISQRHITYMGNELWATNTGTDVSIIYRAYTGMPFHSLNIRIEVR